MSRKKFASWTGFVKGLRKAICAEETHEMPAPEQGPSSAAYLAIEAQRLAETLKNGHSEEAFWRIVCDALKGEDFETPDIPEQARALAEIYWPLTVTTNYDHLLYCACRQVFEDRLPPIVLGRSADDCKQIVSALVSPYDREIVWHIQGFLGEPCRHCDIGSTVDDVQLKQLRRELVIGHAEYRKVANTAVHFRRCFAEVFRTRSFLFLGSSLSEEYFWNLFGETLELCGPSPVPHFALVHKDEHIDARFLAEEMNIAICEYIDHGEVASFLGDLKQKIESPEVFFQYAIRLPNRCSLEINPYSPLPMPDSNTALAIVVRACPEGRFDVDHDLGEQEGELRSRFSNRTFAEKRHVLCAGPGLFALRARTTADTASETGAVESAVRELLDCEVKGHWPDVYLHMPSAGGTVPPVYGFMEVVRAFGNWASTSEHPVRLVAHVGSQVFLNLTSRQLALHELLTSVLIRFWAVVSSGNERDSTRRTIYSLPDAALRDVVTEVLGNLSDSQLSQWSISLCPSPKRTPEPLKANDLEKKLCDVGVVFGSVLTLARTCREPKDIERAGGAAVAGG